MNFLQRENWKEGEGMQGWMVNVSGVNRLASDLEGKHTTIGAARAVVGNIRQNPAVSGEARRTITSVLDRIMESMEQEERNIKDMGASLYKITTVYQNCERRIIDQNIGEKVSKGIHSGDGKTGASGSGESKKEGLSWKWKDIWKFISKVGIIGAGISTIGNLITGDGDLKTILTSGKYTTMWIGGICSAIAKRGSRAEWSPHILGMNNAFSKIDTGSPGKAFTSSVNKQFGYDLNMSKARGWEKGKVGAKWAGHAITALTNGVENYEEFQSGQIGTERAVAETVIETGVDITMGVAATAAITAGAVALGVTAAPAVAVGIAAAGVTWAVNGVCKWATGGKDVGEVVADVVCDVGEKAVAVVKDIGKSAKKAVNSLKKASAGWTRIFSFG